MDNDTTLSYPESWQNFSQLDRIELMLNKMSFGEAKAHSQGFTEGQRDMLKKCVEIIKKDALRWENDVECAGLCSVNAVIEELQALGGKE